MAAAATARLHPTYLDPEILGEEAAAAAEAATATANAAAVAAAAVANSLPEADMTGPEEPPAVPTTPSISTTNVPQPWGELTYTTDTFQAAIPNNSPMQTPGPLGKGVFRLESGPNGAKSRHSRARFNATRRKEVQEVRKIGACIRCRVLRKTCSQGSPCDTCRKVLSPRVWRSGCVRTKFSEQLDLYSAGVQIVLAQARVNSLKQAMPLGNHGVLVEACHFPDCAPRLQLQALHGDPDRDAEGKLVDPDVVEDRPSTYPIVMLDNDNQDVPARVEIYMREVLPELIKREPSHFMQVTLQTAVDVASKTNDELLKKSLELWGLVEILDRERQWTISAKTWAEDAPVKSIKEDTDGELFNTICLQLAAATERKAAAISKALLTGMQRVLQDSKVKIDFNMYFAVLILLNCVEKSSWAFKAWEQENLRHLWPLEKEPVSFAQQGYVIANLLHMLLGIRKALPRTTRREVDGKLVTEEENPAIREYFEAINLDCEWSPETYSQHISSKLTIPSSCSCQNKARAPCLLAYRLQVVRALVLLDPSSSQHRLLTKECENEIIAVSFSIFLFWLRGRSGLSSNGASWPTTVYAIRTSIMRFSGVSEGSRSSNGLSNDYRRGGLRGRVVWYGWYPKWKTHCTGGVKCLVFVLVFFFFFCYFCFSSC